MLCYIRQTALLGLTQEWLFQSFPSLKLSSPRQVTHLALAWDLLLPLA